MRSSYVELLSDFFKFNKYGYGINFIYSLNESRNSFTQILDFHNKLIEVGNKKQPLVEDWETIPLLKKKSLSKLPPLSKKPIYSPPKPILKKIKINKPLSPLNFTKSILISEMPKKKTIRKRLPPPPPPPIKKKPINNVKTNRTNDLKIIKDMFSILSILEQSKNNSFNFDNLLDKFENKKLIEINTKLHKKVINNFHKLKLNEKKRRFSRK